MPVPSELQQTLERLGEHSSIALDASLLVGLVIGLFLWLFGSRIVRPNIALQGVIVGAVAGGLISRSLNLSPVFAYAIGGGIAGGILMWFTYRLWVAMFMAIVLGIIAPMAVMAWYQTPLPDAEQPILEIRQTAADNVHVQQLLAPEQLEEVKQTTVDLLQEFFDLIVKTMNGWWNDTVGPVAKTGVIIGGLAAAAIGLGIGLIFPRVGSAVVSASVGSGFLILCLSGLGQRHFPSTFSHVPTGLRTVVVTLIVATAVGALIQWTILRPKADE